MANKLARRDDKSPRLRRRSTIWGAVRGHHHESKISSVRNVRGHGSVPENEEPGPGIPTAFDPQQGQARDQDKGEAHYLKTGTADVMEKGTEGDESGVPTGGAATAADVSELHPSSGPKDGPVRKEKRKLSSTEFYEELRMSKVLIGVGEPWWSPTPYDALCLVSSISLVLSLVL